MSAHSIAMLDLAEMFTPKEHHAQPIKEKKKKRPPCRLKKFDGWSPKTAEHPAVRPQRTFGIKRVTPFRPVGFHEASSRPTSGSKDMSPQGIYKSTSRRAAPTR